MGMSAGNSAKGGSGRRRGRKHQPMSEINVTPFVDVMLVLLIIFMVAAPMLTVGVPIDLPQSRANALNAETQPITVSINAGGEIFIQETAVELGEVVPRLEAIAQTGYEERIFVRGDRDADYGAVMQVMGRISAAGFNNMGLVSLQEQAN